MSSLCITDLELEEAALEREKEIKEKKQQNQGNLTDLFEPLRQKTPPQPNKSPRKKRKTRPSITINHNEEQRQREIDERMERERERENRYEGARIDDKLYVGGRLAAQNYDWLKETFGDHNVYILNISDTTNYHEDDNRFVYKRIPIADSCESELSQHFDECSNYIAEGLNNDNGVFVHCREGKSRSIAIIISYLMIKRDWSLQKAYQHIVNVLPWRENINQGFKLQLMNLDLKRQGKAEISFDFYDRKNRRRSQTVNYCEIDPNDPDPQEKTTSKLKQTMLSFDSYWKLLATEKTKH